MPAEFCGILKTNFGNLKDPHQYILDQFSGNKALKMMLFGRFKIVKDSMSLEEIYQSFGWKLFRDQLTAIYLYRYEYKNYPVSLDIIELDQIVQFEEKFYPYSLLHDSRSFLLAFYLKMAEITFWKYSGGAKIDLISSAETVFSLMENVKTKNPRIDWLILSLWHFQEYYGDEKLLSMLDTNDFNYKSLYSGLDKKYQTIMTSNLIQYGLSVGDYQSLVGKKPSTESDREQIVL
jgi:hypothetical protein